MAVFGEKERASWSLFQSEEAQFHEVIDVDI
jgi:hypothetical protein